MTGIVFGSHKAASAVRQHLTPESTETVEAHEDERFALLRVSNNIWNNTQPAKDSRFIVFIDGEISYREEVWHKYFSQSVACPSTDHGLILALMNSGVTLEHFAQGCEGTFFIAIFDRLEKIVRFANDRFGLRPHYYSWDQQSLVLAPTIKSCLSAPWVSSEFDWQSVAEYFCFQCVMEERTLLKNIMVFPAGSVGTFNLETGYFEIEPYAQWEELVSESFKGSFEEAADETARLFRRACQATVGDESRLGIYLSGGLDSRLILAATGGGRDMHTFSFGPPDSPDIVYAKRCARIMGTNHHEFFMDDGQWIKEVAEQHTRLTEGGHCLIHAHNLWKVADAKKHIDVNLHGHFGDLMLGGSYTFTGTMAELTDSLMAVFLNKWGGLFNSLDGFAEIFNMGGADMVDAMKSSFEASAAPFMNLPPAMAHDFFALQFHGRKQVQYYMIHNRPCLESRTPFLDLDLLKFIYSLPCNFRADRRLQIAVLERLCPKLTKIPWAGTNLAPVNMGWPKLRSRMEGKINSLFEELSNFKPFSPRGPLFNNCYAGWFGVDLENWIMDTLCSDPCVAWSIFKSSYVKSLVTKHISRDISNQASTTQIGLLLTLELLAGELGFQPHIEA